MKEWKYFVPKTYDDLPVTTWSESIDIVDLLDSGDINSILWGLYFDSPEQCKNHIARLMHLIDAEHKKAIAEFEKSDRYEDGFAY